MPKSNPMNPQSEDPEAVARFAPMAVARATVTEVDSRQGDAGAFHTAQVRVYGDPSPYEAVVLAPSRGDVNIPTEDDDVAVAFGPNGKPFIVGYWYAANKVEDGRVDLPDYEPGERVIGTPLNASFLRISEDGTITIRTDGRAPVNIDHISFVAYMGANQSVAGDSTYYKLQFNTEEDDPENIFDTSAYSFTVVHGGRYEVNATIEMATPGQNNAYRLGIFVNGNLEKRKTQQSAVNEPLGVSVELNKRLEEGDEVDVRLRHNRGAPTTVQGSSITTDFAAERQGI